MTDSLLYQPPTSCKTFTRIATFLIVGLYLVSFFLPVTDAGQPQEMVGYEAFFWGLVSIMFIPMWAANPCLWIGIYYLHSQRWRRAGWLGFSAALLAVSEVWIWDDPPEIGYYLWLITMLILGVTAFIGQYVYSKPSEC